MSNETKTNTLQSDLEDMRAMLMKAARKFAAELDNVQTAEDAHDAVMCLREASDSLTKLAATEAHIAGLRGGTP